MKKNVLQYIVKTDQIINTRQQIKLNDVSLSNNLATIENSIADMIDKNNNIVGKIVGSATQFFNKTKVNNEKNVYSDDVYIDRQDNIYLPDKGNLIIKFCFQTKFDNKTDLVISPVDKIYKTIPIYKSGIFLDKDVKVKIEIKKNYRIITIKY